MRKGSDKRGTLESMDESLESFKHVCVIILILVQCPYRDFEVGGNTNRRPQLRVQWPSIKYVYSIYVEK